MPILSIIKWNKLKVFGFIFNTIAVPEDGSSIPVNIDIVVVLPAPLWLENLN